MRRLGRIAGVSFYEALSLRAMRNFVLRGRSTGRPDRLPARKIRRACAPVLAAAFLAACTITPQSPPEKPAPVPLSELVPGQGRLYFYRPQGSLFPAIRPSVIVNGRKVGVSVAGEVFYRDAYPGRYKVFLASHSKEHLTVTLSAGETQFVRTSIALSWLGPRLSPELVQTDQGQQEMQDLTLVDPRLRQ